MNGSKRSIIAYSAMTLFVVALLWIAIKYGIDGLMSGSTPAVYLKASIGNAGVMFLLAALMTGKFTLSTWRSINLGDWTFFPLAVAIIASAYQHRTAPLGLFGSPVFYAAGIIGAIIYVVARERPDIGIAYLLGSKLAKSDPFTLAFRLSPSAVYHWFSSGYLFFCIFATAIPAIWSPVAWPVKALAILWLLIHFGITLQELVSNKKPKPGAIF